MNLFLVHGRACLAALALLLGGCAAQTAYKEGQALVGQGQVLEGLARFEEASRLEPGDARYRIAAVQTRDRWIQAQLDRGEALRGQGRLEDAELSFRQVLGLQGSNERALAALRLLDQQRRAHTCSRKPRPRQTPVTWVRPA